MNGGPYRGLDEMWPRISAEIESARRRAEVGRGFRRWATVSSVTALAVGLAALGLMRSTRLGGSKRCACVPWEVGQVVPATDVCAEYPLVRGQRVFAVRGAGRDRRVVCIRKRSGSVLWESQPAFSDCRLTADDNRVYLLVRGKTPSWRCVALDVRDGAELWRGPEEEGVVSPSLLTVSGQALAWSRGNRLVLCSAESGNTVWSRTAGPDDTLCAPRAEGQTVFAASRCTVYAFGAANGELLWRRPLREEQTGGHGVGLLEFGNGRVYVANRTSGATGRLFCLHADTGDMLWNASTGAPWRLQAGEGQVFVRSQGLDVFDAQDGARVWAARLGGCGPVSVGKERVYAVDAADRREVVALDRRSGQPAWRRSVAGSCNGVVAVRDMGFISGHDGILYAMTLN
jgi:outer membrane protein assembly factor BamB